MRLVLPAALVLPLLAGCPAFTSMGPARTVPRGESHRWASLGAYRTVLVTSNPPAPDERSEVWLPLLEVGVRFGLSESADLTLRAGTGGASIAPRFQLRRSPDPESGVDVLVEPSVGFTGLLAGSQHDVVTGVSVGLALPVGVNLGSGHQLVLTPRAAGMTGSALGGGLLAGGSAGFVLRIADGARGPWYLVPECGLAHVQGGRDWGGPMVQCALGLAGPQ